MISEEDAKKVAHQYIVDLEPDIGESLQLIESDTIGKCFGWVFFYNSKEYLETGDFRYMLAGNAPFIVDRKNGKVQVTGTSRPIEDYVAEYESQWREG